MRSLKEVNFLGLMFANQNKRVDWYKVTQRSNTVCILKLIWRIVTANHSLWVRWIQKNLIRRGTLWSVKENTSLCSWMWKKILKYRDTAHDLYKIEVWSGESTSFWYDIWCPLGNLFKVLGSRGTIDLGIVNHVTVAEVMNLHRRKRHRVDLLNQIENDIDIDPFGNRNMMISKASFHRNAHGNKSE